MPQFSQRIVNRVLVICMIVGFLAMLAVLGRAAITFRRNLEYTDLVQHTQEVEQAVANFSVLTERSETTRRGYLLSHREDFLDTYRTTQAALDPALERLAGLTADNPRQRESIARLRQLRATQKAAADASIAQASAGSLLPIQNFALDTAVAQVREIRALIRRMEAEERALLAQRKAERSRSLGTLRGRILTALILLTIVAATSTTVLLRFTKDLSTSREALRKLNEGLEAEVASRTADLKRANDEIQRFAYIVSHDLRSPLVNVMGFTSELEAALKPVAKMVDQVEAEAPQLVLKDAVVAVREDAPEALAFIRTSTQKMDRLINAILKLSREGRRVLTPERLDMQTLLGGIADGLKHRSDALGARIEVDGDLPDIVSDRLAVEQVFSNLMENALKYLKPGRPGHIVVRGRTQHGRAIFEIEDNGRGIDPKDHERVFELFRRSGAQDQPGEGIGLAHVRALGYRLGGTVNVDSALDRGSIFRVSLPLQLVAEGAAA